MSFLAETLSQFWLSIQGRLFPWLEEELGELSEKQRQLVSILELAKIESFIATSRGWPGRPEKDRRAIARAFVAKVVYNMVTTRQLIERLGSDITEVNLLQRVLTRIKALHCGAIHPLFKPLPQGNKSSLMHRCLTANVKGIRLLFIPPVASVAGSRPQ